MRRHTGTHTKSFVAREVLTYLVEHPEAQDTLEGVMEWWLLEREIKRQTALVREALSELVEQGLVIEQSGGGRTRYQVNSARLREIGELINEEAG